MSGFVGADVDQLLRLANRVEVQSHKFSEIAASSSTALMTAEWTGAEIDRIRSEWDRQSKPAMQRMSANLAALAIELRKQAAQQEATSSADLRARRKGQGIADGVIDPTDKQYIDRLLTILGGALNSADLYELLKEVFGSPGSKLFSTLIGPVGLLLEGSEIADRFGDRDYLGGFLHLGSGTAQLTDYIATIGNLRGVAARLSPLALGISALVSFVDITLPYSPERQNSTLDMGAEHMFGPDVSRDNLTPEQASALARRYDLPWGPAVMISDTMDATAKRIFPWNWGK